MNESLILYKLMILNMLDSVSFPLTNSQLTEFILEKEYTDYFTVQNTISELLESDLILAEQLHHACSYTLTEEGAKTLTYYHHILPDGVIADTASYLKEHKLELKQKLSVLANFEAVRDHEFLVHMKVMEQDEILLHIDIKVPSEEFAERMCSRWNNCHEEIYAHIMNLLAFQEKSS